ncbi:hypothetical protein H2198_000722 [Neophaeococcomyces mojaviensis]|uniref:Uncharacterized protein n=1 Tax=Neophaeococcomyces mojaviensis TaxID=3383035 RepID=A0ACC3AJ90_9EURO|nr:hypothetical protein H2198_000722 [Knufia sp. JES_112]
MHRRMWKRVVSKSIVYGKDTITYKPCVDTVSLGSLSVKKFRFGGAAGRALTSESSKHLAQGILGLSPSPPAEFKNQEVLSDRANLIQCLEGQIFRPVCTLIGPKVHPAVAADLEKTGARTGRGVLAVGELPRDFFSGQIAWCPNLVRDKWIVELDEVRINDIPLPARRRTALIDTGTSFILPPAKDFDEIVKMLEGTKHERPEFFKVAKDKLKNVSFHLGGKQGRSLALNQDDLFLREDPSGIVISTLVQKPGLPKDDEYMDYWVLGGIFLDNVVTAFAYSPFGAISSVGFADIPETDFKSWKANPENDPWDTAYTGQYFKT